MKLCQVLTAFILVQCALVHLQTVAIAQTLTRFAVIGDYGISGQAEADVASLVISWNPEFIITLGDNNYETGAQATIDANIGQYYHEFISPYIGTFGSGDTVNRFFPSLGNHDWNTAGALPYLNYFTLPGNERYYDFVWGTVHFFAIDSDPHEPDGIDSSSVQALWLKNKLSQSTAQWKIVYFHHAPYSSCERHGSHPVLQWPFKKWGATTVLAGHDHTYERIFFDGFTYFVNGLGGKSIYSFTTPVAGSQVRYNGDYGAMLAEANNDSLFFRFITRAGVTIDQYAIYDTDTMNLSFSIGWNLFSLPIKTQDAFIPSLFPDQYQKVFSFVHNSFILVDSLQFGRGYWAKVSDVQTIDIAGDSVFQDTIQFSKGWNIIGGLSKPVAVTSIEEQPPKLVASPFYRYSGNYISSDTLQPGQGYWFKAHESGWLILSSHDANTTSHSKPRKKNR